MKIAQFISRMDVLGGAQIHVRDLAVGLLKEGHEIVVLSMGSGPLTEELNEYGISCIQIKNLVLNIHPFKDIKALFELRKILQEIKPDLLAIHSSKAGIIGRIAGRTLGIPTVFTAHGWSFTEGISRIKRKIYAMLERKIGRISPGIITVSKYDYMLAAQNKVVPIEKMKVIPNGIPDVPSSLISDPSKKPVKLVMVARFAFPKDHLLIIQALDKLREMDWQMDFIGDGPLRKEVKDHVKNYNLSERIYFLGDRLDVSEQLTRAQVFVLTTKLEGLPISIIEAMRSGLPVIASDVGGVSEMITNALNGYVIPRGDCEMLVERLKTLLANPELREQMGQESRKVYEKNFSFTKMRNATLDFYKEVIESSQ